MNRTAWHDRFGVQGRRAAARLLTALFTSLLLLSACSKDQAAGGKGGAPGGAKPPVPVTVGQAVRETVPLEIETFGAVQAAATVQVKSEVGGLLETHIHKGQAVRKGDLLFTIDQQPFEASLKQAQANLARDKAQGVDSAADANRTEELFKKGIASPSDRDKAISASDALAAAVKADEAAVENAQIQLNYCSIRSPIDGRVSTTCCDNGNLVKANDQELTSINQISPADVLFSITQDDLPTVRQYMAAGKIAVSATIPGQKQSEEGELTYIDNSVDKTTGTILVGASFPNTDEHLWPGQYVRVRIVLAQQKDKVVVPSRAVQVGQNGKYVFVISPDRVASLKTVKTGQLIGSEIVISDGLQGDETVVTDGHLRITVGDKVVFQNAASQPATQRGSGV